MYNNFIRRYIFEDDMNKIYERMMQKTTRVNAVSEMDGIIEMKGELNKAIDNCLRILKQTIDNYDKDSIKANKMAWRKVANAENKMQDIFDQVRLSIAEIKAGMEN